MIQKVKGNRQWVIVFIGMLSIFVGLGLARFGYTPILEPMRDALQLTYTHMGMIASANFLGYVILSPFVGYFASKYGSKRVAAISLFFTSITMILTGFVNSFLQAAFLRFLTGAGSAGVNVSIVGLASKWFGVERRGLALGIINAGSSVGIITVGFAIPAIAASFPEGWRIGWLFMGVVGLAVTVLSLFLKESPEKAVSSAGVLGITAVYRSSALLKLGLVYTLFGLSYIIFATFYASHLVNLGFDIAMAGYFWSFVGFFSIFSTTFWGAVSDRIGRQKGLAIVYLLLGTSILVFGISSSLPGLLLGTAMAGAVIFAIPSIVQAYCGDIAGGEAAAAAIGFVTLFFGVGQMIGPSIGGYLADLTGNFVATLTFAGVTAITGGILTLLRGD